MIFKILVIDDEEALTYSIKRVLENEGEAEIDTAFSGKAGIELYLNKRHDIVITDLIMDGMNGLEVMKEIKRFNSEAIVIMMTGKGSEQIASEAIKNGAYDYFSKPFDYTEFFKTIRNAKETISLRAEKKNLEEQKQGVNSFFRINYSGLEMARVVDMIKKIAVTDCSVLIIGESGTGKELVAESIHNAGNRKNNPFIKINCGAIPENLMESEIFGYEKGAFTGANSVKKGKLELADRGTLFLDEIGEMSMELQVKLLRVLEDGYIDKVGGTSPKKVDVRIIAATNINLEKSIEEKKFRLDLYYRLNVFKINVPSLRERKEDIIYLAEKMVMEYSQKFGIKAKKISEEAKKAFLSYNWPGNVRELKNSIQSILIMAKSENIEIDDLPENMRRGPLKMLERPLLLSEEEEKLSFKEYMKKKEREYLEFIQKKYGDNKSEMARVMGVTRRTVYEKLSEHNLEDK